MIDIVIVAALGVAVLATMWGLIGFFSALLMAGLAGVVGWLLWKNVPKSHAWIASAAAVFFLTATVGPAISRSMPFTSAAIARQQVLRDVQVGQAIDPTAVGAKIEVAQFVQQLDDQSVKEINQDLQNFAATANKNGGYTTANLQQLQQNLLQVTNNVAAAHALAAAVIYGGDPPPATTPFGKRVENFFSWPNIFWPAAVVLIVLWGSGALLKKPHLQKAGVGLSILALLTTGAWTLVNGGGATTLASARHAVSAAAMPSHMATIVLPTDGSPSSSFDPTLVPAGWWYTINAPSGTTAHWSDGESSPAQQGGHPGQSFSLSLTGGGVAQVVWQPTPFTNTGQ